MRIAELETASNLPRSTIRYYEQIGLLSPVRRDQNGYRTYDRHHLTELIFISKAQFVGFTLDEVRPALDKLRAPPEHCEALLASLHNKRREILLIIEQEHQRLATLDRLIERFAGGDPPAAAPVQTP
ncbi:MerR family transcriptional regulator [Chitinimonas sp. BJYL2]|uniref:MerR family transcriptional regulator n=1 Tax=Chitinimonas sp. BJYL2 TaxID=2976696 RepID=UPI0022B3ECFF|nr:MerR family transcriptional regulator [Chitinimonas sp. BJYL2]